MNTNKKRIIAVICLLVFIVGIFVACKKKDTDENLVSVSTDENGSLFYTDPTYEVDGIEYGGETHFVKPEETNKNGEYKIYDVTSKPYTTDNDGNVAPVGEEVTTTSDNSDKNTTTTEKNASSETKTTGSDSNNNPTSSGSDSKPTDSTTSEVETSELHGIEDVVDDNNLNNDGVINAW